MSSDASSLTMKKISWFAEPKPGHVVQFYTSKDGLLSSLYEYVTAGIRGNDNCIVIATKPRLRSLEELLRRNGFNISAGYVTFDANDMIKQFMVNSLPDWQRFLDTVGAVVEDVIKRGKPVRAYGEMVALLWQQGNKEAVMQLEEFWNRLAATQPFSLYCAYPKLHFIMHGEDLKDIAACHNLSTTN